MSRWGLYQYNYHSSNSLSLIPVYLPCVDSPQTLLSTFTLATYTAFRTDYGASEGSSSLSHSYHPPRRPATQWTMQFIALWWLDTAFINQQLGCLQRKITPYSNLACTPSLHHYARRGGDSGYTHYRGKASAPVPGTLPPAARANLSPKATQAEEGTGLVSHVYWKSDSTTTDSDSSSRCFEVHPHSGLRDLQVGQTAEVLEDTENRSGHGLSVPASPYSLPAGVPDQSPAGSALPLPPNTQMCLPQRL